LHLINYFSTFVFHLKEIPILEKILHFANKKPLLFTSTYLQNRINSQIEMHHLLTQYLCRALKQHAQETYHCTCSWLCNTAH